MRKVPFQFVERPIPAPLVAEARFLVVQPRMRKGQQGAFRNRAKFDLDERLAGVRAAVDPSPAHREPFGFFDREIFAAAFMLGAVELECEIHIELSSSPTKKDNVDIVV